MKHSSTVLLKIIIILLGMGVLTGMISIPPTEGRNVNADLMTVYFRDPFLAYVYLGSLPFFTALFYMIKFLGYIEHNKTFTQLAVNTLRNIQYCGIALLGFIFGAVAFIMTTGEEDKAGFIALCIFITIICLTITVVTAIFQKVLQNVVDKKSENDLTI